MNIIIDNMTTESNYGFDCKALIVDTETHGRLLFTQGYCGEGQLRGGAVRWDGGLVVSLKSEDTFETLKSEKWNEATSLYEAIIQGCDESRPVLQWHGNAIYGFVKSL